MCNMKIFHKSSMFILLFFLISTNAFGIMFGDSSDDGDDTALLDPTSFLFDNTNKKMKTMGVERIESTNIVSDSLNHQGQDTIFYKRLISLLLSNMSIRKDGDVIKGTLHVTALPSQWEILENCWDPKVSVRELDGILDDVIKKSSSDYMTHTLVFLDSLFRIIRENERPTYLISVTILAIILLRRIRWSMGYMLFIFFICVFIISFFITWWQMIQDAEIKLMVSQKKFEDMPEACNPSKMNLWNKFIHSVTANKDCEEYYKSILSKSVLQVTPALALSQLLSTLILHPVTCIGQAISSFVDNATSNMWWPPALIVKLFFFCCFGILIILCPFFITGGSISLGLGPLFNFSLSGRNKNVIRSSRIEELDYDKSSTRVMEEKLFIKEKEEETKEKLKKKQKEKLIQSPLKQITLDKDTSAKQIICNEEISNVEKLSEQSSEKNVVNNEFTDDLTSHLKFRNVTSTKELDLTGSSIDLAGGDTIITNPLTTNNSIKK